MVEAPMPIKEEELKFDHHGSISKYGTTVILVFLSGITLLGLPSTEADYLAHFCPKHHRFHPKLHLPIHPQPPLLHSLFQRNPRHGLHNATAGQNPNDTVYGLFLCRGDAPLQIASPA
ncbi:hypothetical protein M0R45_012998 [Rubus argutus]|uniref:Uncharacterized protein n=1 Tax=Rubus argutus TaxID=59490 RepID=A0AAW1XK91_RUBAR